MLSRVLSRLQPRLRVEMSSARASVVQGPSSRDTATSSRFLGVLASAHRGSLARPHASSSSFVCSCGCGIHGIHTRGDRELVEFLQEEIGAEKKNLKAQVSSHLDDFSVKVDQAEVTLTRNFHDEKITVTMNVNHTVDGDTAELSADQTEASLKSQPSFEVDIQIGTKIMSFTCSYLNPEISEGGQNPEGGMDTFGINELTMYEGEWSEATYCMSGDIMDGVMYDLLMNMLAERGITDEFADKLSTFCSDYEHSLYVSLLQKVQDFVKRK